MLNDIPLKMFQSTRKTTLKEGGGGFHSPVATFTGVWDARPYHHFIVVIIKEFDYAICFVCDISFRFDFVRFRFSRFHFISFRFEF